MELPVTLLTALFFFMFGFLYGCAHRDANAKYEMTDQQCRGLVKVMARLIGLKEYRSLFGEHLGEPAKSFLENTIIDEDVQSLFVAYKEQTGVELYEDERVIL